VLAAVGCCQKSAIVGFGAEYGYLHDFCLQIQ
jgi:hypothetical protein